MSSHDLAAAYALDALAPDEARAFERHAATCERCRHEVDELSEAAAALAHAVPPSEPPAELRERLLADTRRKAPVVPLRWAVSAAVAVAAAIALAIGLGRALDDGPGTRTVALVGATGSLVVEPGGRARLVVDGLPAAPAGRTYEAWVVGPHGPVPAGMFRGGPHTIHVLTRPVPRGSRVAVTLEQAGGVPRMGGAPIIRTAGAA